MVDVPRSYKLQQTDIIWLVGKQLSGLIINKKGILCRVVEWELQDIFSYWSRSLIVLYDPLESELESV